MASSRSGTMALIAAWKASSRELFAVFLAFFGFDVESCRWSDVSAIFDDSSDFGG